MIFWIAVTLLFVVSGQDVSFQYDSCYSEDEGITMTATYTGSETVTVVQWYYSGKTANNLFVVAATCLMAGLSPPGYPNASQMSFDCPSTNPALPSNTFKLTVTGLQEGELENSWGATFSLTNISPPDVVKSSFSVCSPGGFPIWQIIVIVIVICFLSLGIILGVFMYYVNKDWNIIFISVYLNTPWPVWISCLIVVGFGILIVFVIKHISARIGIHNSKNNRTSPNCTDTGSNTGNTISTAGNPQPPNSHEKQHPFNQTTLHTEDGSAAYTKKKPPAKLRELDEAGSEKHHLGGRPLPEIGKYNKT